MCTFRSPFCPRNVWARVTCLTLARIGWSEKKSQKDVVVTEKSEYCASGGFEIRISHGSLERHDVSQRNLRSREI